MFMKKTDASIDRLNSSTLSKCRICLKQGEIYIFSTENLLEQIAEFGSLTITEDDPYPKYICEPCHLLLKAALLFRRKAKKTEKKLYSKQLDVNKIPHKPENSNIELTKEYLSKKEPSPFSDTSEALGFKEIIQTIPKCAFTEKTQSGVNSDDEKLNLDVSNKEDTASDSSGSERVYLDVNYDFDDNIQQIEKLQQLLEPSFKEDCRKTSQKITNGYIKPPELNIRNTATTKNIEDVVKLQNSEPNIKLNQNVENNLQNQLDIIINRYAKPLKCNLKKIISNKELPRINSEDNTLKSGYNCGVCNEIIENIVELEKHCELQHNIKITDKIKCDVCFKDVTIATQDIHMEQHKIDYENQERKEKVECKVCKKLIIKTYINYHMKMHGTKTEQDQRKKTCEICKKSVSTRYFNSHLRKIHKLNLIGEKSDSCNNEVVYQSCYVCQKQVHKSRYKDHLAGHGNVPESYVCEHCAKVFTNRASFKRHQLIHSEDFKYKCQFCPYRCQYLGLLQVHVKTHKGEYNYKCPKCSAKFLTKSNLNQHLQRHGQGHIKCYECNLYFFRKNNMEKHYFTSHVGLRDVICDECGKGFGHRDELLGHQLRVHNRERLMKRVPNYLKAAREKEKTETDQHF